jgi:hypothetical protein
MTKHGRQLASIDLDNLARVSGGLRTGDGGCTRPLPLPLPDPGPTWPDFKLSTGTFGPTDEPRRS